MAHSYQSHMICGCSCICRNLGFYLCFKCDHISCFKKASLLPSPFEKCGHCPWVSWWRDVQEQSSTLSMAGPLSHLLPVLLSQWGCGRSPVPSVPSGAVASPLSHLLPVGLWQVPCSIWSQCCCHQRSHSEFSALHWFCGGVQWEVIEVFKHLCTVPTISALQIAFPLRTKPIGIEEGITSEPGNLQPMSRGCSPARAAFPQCSFSTIWS